MRHDATDRGALRPAGRIAATSPRVSVSRQVFGCPTCGNRFTPPLRRLPEALRVRSGARCCEAPEGFYVVHDAPMDRPGCGVAVNPHDVRNVIPHPDPYRRAGCCGVSYVTRLPNLRCARCGDDVGYELSDGDHAEHVIYLPTHPRAEVPCDEPGDASVMARAEARWRIPDPAPADEGLDALPARLRVEVDTLFEREPQDPSRFPALHDVGVAVHAREVRLFLDGVCVRPPWPEGERDRVVALGAIPGGGASVPLCWWSTEPARGSGHNLHHWYQWRVGETLCVLWDRWPESCSTDRLGVAFQLPWELWELAWREALG